MKKQNSAPREADAPRVREAWSPPKLIELAKLSQTSKVSWNTEGGFISGLS